MKRLPMTISIGLFVAAMAAPALAADLSRPVYKTPVYSMPGYNWTGLYAGINGGYGFGSSNWAGAGSSSPKGALVGGTLGYNLQTGSLVWGLEGDLDYSWMKGSNVGTGVCAGLGCETRNTWFGTARGRIGYAGWDRWLPYFTGGAAFGDVKMTSGTAVSKSKTRFGWTIGAQGERPVTSLLQDRGGWPRLVGRVGRGARRRGSAPRASWRLRRRRPNRLPRASGASGSAPGQT